MPREVHNQLTAAQVARTRKPGRFADGNGLYLLIAETGAKFWIWRGVVRGRRRELGLGPVRLYSLAEARETAREYRKMAREGRDPKAERDDARRKRMTFREAADRYFKEAIEPAQTPGEATRWRGMINLYAIPKIGTVEVASATPDDVLTVLRPIWLAKPETARRVLARVRHVFDWCAVGGHRTDANPTASVRAALPKHGDRKQHFTALPYADLPALLRRIEAAKGMGALALRFTILTAARSGEVRGATWAEIDLGAATWAIPGSRMKMGAAHRVPLSAPALAILRHIQPLGGDLVFPSTKPGRPLSDMTLSAVLRRLDVPVTVHGFRSTFRDWAEEQTDYAHEVKEQALAHKIGGAVERAYRRTDLFDRRRALMDEWAAYCGGRA